MSKLSGSAFTVQPCPVSQTRAGTDGLAQERSASALQSAGSIHRPRERCAGPISGSARDPISSPQATSLTTMSVRDVVRQRPDSERSRTTTSGGGGIRTHERLSPTHAFEACSFGRSDTPPWGRLLEPVPLKEIEQDLRALRLADSADHLDPMRGPTVAYDVPNRPACAGLRVPGPQHQTLDPRQHQRPCAHDTGLESDDESAVLEAPLPQCCCGGTYGDHLGVRGRVSLRFAHVAPDPEDLP